MLQLVRCECECSHAPDLAARRAQLDGVSLERSGDFNSIAGFYLWARAVFNTVGHSCMIRNPLFRRFEVKDNPLYQGKQSMPVPPSRSEPPEPSSSALALCGCGSAPSSPKPKKPRTPKKKKVKTPKKEKAPRTPKARKPRRGKGAKRATSCMPFWTSKKPRKVAVVKVVKPKVLAAETESSSSKPSSRPTSRAESSPGSWSGSRPETPSSSRPTSPSPARSEASTASVHSTSVASAVSSLCDMRKPAAEKQVVKSVEKVTREKPKETVKEKPKETVKEKPKETVKEKPKKTVKDKPKRRKSPKINARSVNICFPLSLPLRAVRAVIARPGAQRNKKQAHRGHLEGRKNELNRALREQWLQQREAKEESKKAKKKKDKEEKKKRKEKLQKAKLSKEEKTKLDLQKRQEKPISFLDCLICNQVMKYAVEIDCGHAFCSSCLRKKMNRSKLCPVCMSEIEYVHPSYVLRELVQKFGHKDGAKKLKADLLQASSYFEERDPMVIAFQFVPQTGRICCASTKGAFDPADLYRTTRLDEYVSDEEYSDTIKMVNQIAASWSSSALANCLGTICCCLFPSQVKRIVSMIEIVLGDCNIKWPETGLFWTLMCRDGDTKSARSLDQFFLILRIDPLKARAYQNTLRAGGLKKDVEIARLRKQNALMRHKMLELGENSFIRALVGRKDSSKYSLKTQASMSFVQEYPDSPVISATTLRDLVLHNPLSTRYFIPPWNRLRSTSSGPLPLSSEEDYQMRNQLSSFISRSPSPVIRSASPNTRARSPNRSEKGVSPQRRNKSPYEPTKRKRHRQ